MAYTKKNETESSQTNSVENKDVSEAKSEKKKFSPDEMITCISITPGEMFYIGKKSQTLYTFANINDTVEIEFRDLIGRAHV